MGANSITTGYPAASVSRIDAGVFFQDDWRIVPQFTLSAGLRYELQNDIHDRSSIAPRAGLAWAPGGGNRKQPLAVIRAGFGGNLSSPSFNSSVALAGYGPHNDASANRTIELQVRFSF